MEIVVDGALYWKRGIQASIYPVFVVRYNRSSSNSVPRRVWREVRARTRTEHPRALSSAAQFEAAARSARSAVLGLLSPCVRSPTRLRAEPESCCIAAACCHG